MLHDLMVRRSFAFCRRASPLFFSRRFSHCVPTKLNAWKRLTVSALHSGSSGPDLSPVWGHWVVFLGE